MDVLVVALAVVTVAAVAALPLSVWLVARGFERTQVANGEPVLDRRDARSAQLQAQENQIEQFRLQHRLMEERSDLGMGD